MANLTIEKDIVIENAGTDPIPYRDVIIFKKSGKSMVFHSIIEPNQKLEKKLWESKSDFVGYAVTKSTSITHEFSKRYQHVSQLFAFTLDFSITLAVSNARDLVDKLQGDPLTALQTKITKVIGDFVRQMEQQRVQRRTNVQMDALNDKRADNSGQFQSTNLQTLENYATEQSLELREIQFDVVLSEKDLKVNLAEQDLKSHKALAIIEEEKKAQAIIIEQNLERAKTIGNTDLLKLQRGQRHDEFLYENLQRIITQCTSGNDPLAALLELKARVPELVNNSGDLMHHSAQSQGPVDVNVTAQTFALTDSSPNLQKFMGKFFELFGPINCDPTHKRLLFANVLRLSGELLLAEHCDDELVDKHIKAIEALIFEQIFNDYPLSEEQIAFVNQIKNSDEFKAQLGV
jgi:hypothetical protein